MERERLNVAVAMHVFWLVNIDDVDEATSTATVDATYSSELALDHGVTGIN